MENIGFIAEPYNEEWSIKEFVTKRPPVGWEDFFYEVKDEFDFISDYLSKNKFYPQKKDLFKAFDLCHPLSIKVVIMGQDPYYQSTINGCIAQGLSFSIPSGEMLTSSLRNIFKEVKSSYPSFEPKNGDLTNWANQGVFLLNSALSVAPGEPESHIDMWISFVPKVITALSLLPRPPIFVLWGKKAQNLKKYIEGKPPILIAPHPSGMNVSGGFLGCGHFKKINDILIERGQEPIKW